MIDYRERLYLLKRLYYLFVFLYPIGSGTQRDFNPLCLAKL